MACIDLIERPAPGTDIRFGLAMMRGNPFFSEVAADAPFAAQRRDASGRQRRKDPLLVVFMWAIACPAGAQANDDRRAAHEAEERRIVQAFLVDRYVSERRQPICFNSTLLPLDRAVLKDLKSRVRALAWEKPDKRLEVEIRKARLPRLYDRRKSIVVEIPSSDLGSVGVRAATWDECSRITTYRLRRVFLKGGSAIVFGVNPRFGVTLSFVGGVAKEGGSWKTGSYRRYNGIPGPPASAEFRRLSPGEARDKFYILGGAE